MKKLIAVILALAVSVGMSSRAGTPINPTELPEAAQAFIAKNFPTDVIKKVEKDNGRRGVEYEVDFISGAEVDFMSQGEWKEVKAARGSAVPSDIVPAAIVKHVSTNYDGMSIVEISRKRGGYEVELSNGTELMLTEDAKPIQPRQRGNGEGARGNGRGR